jgi:septal ring factor EnvC (AmiA/AmiB activator)
MRRHHIWLGFLFFAIASCSDPNEARRQFLLTELQQLEHNYSLIAQEMASKQQQVSFLQQKLQQQRSELADYNRQVEAYISNHKMAVAALAAGVGGAAVAYDPNNEFSDDVQAVAGLVGLVAGIWALNNMEEVSQVADQLMQADRYVKSLEAQIESTQSELNSTSEPIAQLQNSLNSMQTTYNARKTELESLR